MNGRKFRAQRSFSTREIEYVTWNMQPGDTVIIPAGLCQVRHIGAQFTFDGYRVQVIGHQANTGAVVCQVVDESPEAS